MTTRSIQSGFGIGANQHVNKLISKCNCSEICTVLLPCCVHSEQCVRVSETELISATLAHQYPIPPIVLPTTYITIHVLA